MTAPTQLTPDERSQQAHTQFHLCELRELHQGNQRSAQSGCKVSPKEKTALQILNQLSDQVQKLRYPNVPYLVAAKYSDKTANQLTLSVIAWIRLNGGNANRINCMGRPVDHRKIVSDCLGNQREIGSVTWLPSTTTRGISDIVSLVKSKHLSIEIKIHDRQSEHQKAYQQSIEAAGGIYLIVRNFQQFYDWYKSEFK